MFDYPAGEDLWLLLAAGYTVALIGLLLYAVTTTSGRGRRRNAKPGRRPSER